MLAEIGQVVDDALQIAQRPVGADLGFVDVLEGGQVAVSQFEILIRL